MPTFLLGAGAFAFYLLTMAPTVLWGDDAELQRLAWTGEASHGIRAYRLWVMTAHVLAHALPGNPAWRVNVVSGIFAVVALVLCFLYLRRAHTTVASIFATSCLAVSHTFWMHAVRAEVYSSYAAWFFLTLLTAAWARASGRNGRWALTFFIAGLGLFFHLMSVLLLAPLSWLAWWDRAARSRLRLAVVSALAYAGGVSAFLAVGILTGTFTPNELSGTGGVFAFLRPPFGLAYLAYQFPFVLPVAILGLVHAWKHDRPWTSFVALLFLVHFAFAHGVHAPDQFVFFLGAYLACTLALAPGFAALVSSRSKATARGWAVGLFLIGVAGPLFVDVVAAWATRQAGWTLPGPRELPYRDNARFFLIPDKHGERAAERYGEEALAAMPHQAAILADPLPYQTLRWFQDALGRRRDIRIEVFLPGTQSQLSWLLEQSRQRPTFLAAIGPYYDMEEIEKHFRVEPVSVIYRLVPVDSTGGP